MGHLLVSWHRLQCTEMLLIENLLPFLWSRTPVSFEMHCDIQDLHMGLADRAQNKWETIHFSKWWHLEARLETGEDLEWHMTVCRKQIMSCVSASRIKVTIFSLFLSALNTGLSVKWLVKWTGVQTAKHSYKCLNECMSTQVFESFQSCQTVELDLPQS